MNVTQKPRLAAEMEQDLRTMIVAGKPPVGEKLPAERLLCETCGVSRTVVREAIAGLRAAGLIESRRGSGLFVRSANAFYAALRNQDKAETNRLLIEFYPLTDLHPAEEAELDALIRRHI